MRRDFYTEEMTTTVRDSGQNWNTNIAITHPTLSISTMPLLLSYRRRGNASERACGTSAWGRGTTSSSSWYRWRWRRQSCCEGDLEWFCQPIVKNNNVQQWSSLLCCHHDNKPQLWNCAVLTFTTGVVFHWCIVTWHRDMASWHGVSRWSWSLVSPVSLVPALFDFILAPNEKKLKWTIPVITTAFQALICMSWASFASLPSSCPHKSIVSLTYYVLLLEHLPPLRRRAVLSRALSLKRLRAQCVQRKSNDLQQQKQWLTSKQVINCFGAFISLHAAQPKMREVARHQAQEHHHRPLWSRTVSCRLHRWNILLDFSRCDIQGWRHCVLHFLVGYMARLVKIQEIHISWSILRSLAMCCMSKSHKLLPLHMFIIQEGACGMMNDHIFV